MKKLALILMAAATPTIVSAHKDSFTGAYVTGGIGATNAQFHVQPNFTVQSPVIFLFPGSYETYGNSASGFVGLSYLYEFSNNFVIGALATAGYTNINIEHEEVFEELVVGVVSFDVRSHLEMQLTNDFAVLLKAGIASGKNTFFYALIGPRFGNFETKATTFVDLIVGGPPLTESMSNKTSGYETGITAGIGLQQKIYDNLSLSLEYDYTSYGEISAPSIQDAITTSGSIVGSVSDQPDIDASSHTVSIALSYQW